MESGDAQTLSRRARGFYQVTFSDHSMRELNKLPVEDQLALVDKISTLSPTQLDKPDGTRACQEYGKAIGQKFRD